MYSLCDEVVVFLGPVGGAVQTGRGVPQDLKQGPGGVEALERSFSVAQLNSRYTCTKGKLTAVICILRDIQNSAQEL